MGTTGTPTPIDPGRDFLGWLEAMRAERDVSWAEVSRRSGISETGLRKIRQGEATPRPATIQALAKAFGIVADDDAPMPGMSATSSMAAMAAMAAVPVLPPPIPARRGDGGATTFLTVGVRSARASRLDPDTAGRLILFLEHSARAWLATADCPEGDD